MKVTVNSQQLAVMLRAMNKIVPSKPTFEILSHTLMSTPTPGSVEFYSTDLEVALSMGCSAAVTTPGRVALPVAKLLQMVEQFPDADVDLALDKAQVLVKCGGFTSKLRVLPVEDFPQTPAVEGTACEIDAAALRSLVERTRHAISANATKYVLKGALLTCSGEGVAMVATEGTRLTLATAARPAGPDLDVVVPVKALDVLAEGGDEGTVTFTLGDRHLFFEVNGKVLTSRKLEGAFPAYNRIIPRENDKKIVIEHRLLAAALRRVVLAAEENGVVYITISAGLLELSAASAGIGSAFEPVVVGYDGPPLKILINGSYVLDFLNATEAQIVTLELKDEKTAALLTAGADHIGVIMLMRP